MKSLRSRSLTLEEFPSVVRNIFFIPGSEGPEKENTLLKLGHTHQSASAAGVTVQRVFSYVCMYVGNLLSTAGRSGRCLVKSRHMLTKFSLPELPQLTAILDTHTHICSRGSSCSDPFKTAIKPYAVM